MDTIRELLVRVFAGVATAAVTAVVRTVEVAVTAAVTHPTVASIAAAVAVCSLAAQLLRLRRLGLLAAGTAVFSLAALGVLWREAGRIRRAAMLGLIAGVPLGCAYFLVAGGSTARWNAVAVACGWALLVFAPGDLLWRGQPGGWVWERLGTGTLAAWWTHQAARETIESTFRRTVDPRTEVSRVRPVADGRWDVRVLVPEKMSPEAVATAVEDATIGSSLTRVAREKGFGEVVQDVVVMPGERSEGLGVQRVSIMTGAQDPLADVSYWRVPESQPDTLAKIEVGRYANGEPVLIDVPGVGGGHVLVGGESGSGKTTIEDAVIGQLSYRKDVALILSDPKWVGMIKHRQRATTIALGAQVATPTLLALAELMDRRKQKLAGVGLEDWDLALGPWVVAVFDEAGVLGLSKLDSTPGQAMFEILSQGRALGVGVLLAMHRPSTSKLAGDLRDLFPVRIGLAMGSGDASQMIFGDQPPPAHKISEREKGVGYVRLGRTSNRFRGHLSPRPANEIAVQTSHLRVLSGVGEFADWPWQASDPTRDPDKSAWKTWATETKNTTNKQRRGTAVVEETE